ncbi:MAG: hypothetical protein K2L04_05275 [Alistipes sp.]|nr:hypothetical protein [Alistipes sp.]
MDLLRSCLAAGAGHTHSPEELDALVAEYGWCSPVRILRELHTGTPDPMLSIVAPWRAQSSLRQQPVDAGAFAAEPASDPIDRFLQETDLRIVAEEGEPETEVRTAPCLSDAEEVVSEELAQIYLAQGLTDRAAAIYRKLSLLNPEKSVYFAELIAQAENNN